MAIGIAMRNWWARSFIAKFSPLAPLEIHIEKQLAEEKQAKN